MTNHYLTWTQKNVIYDAKIRIFVESAHLFVTFFTNNEESRIKCR